jgi:hypothetical protein
MHSYIYYFGAAGLLLLLSTISILLWDKFTRLSKCNQGDGSSEGAFRGFYHAIWALIIWSVFALFVPLWLSYRSRLVGLEPSAKLLVVLKILSTLVVLVLLLFYGLRRGYLFWIDGAQWPDKENK